MVVVVVIHALRMNIARQNNWINAFPTFASCFGRSKSSIPASMVRNVTCSYSLASCSLHSLLPLTRPQVLQVPSDEHRCSILFAIGRAAGTNPAVPSRHRGSALLSVVGKLAGFVDRVVIAACEVSRDVSDPSDRPNGSREFSRRVNWPRDAIVSSHLAKRRPGLSKRGQRVSFNRLSTAAEAIKRH